MERPKAETEGVRPKADRGGAVEGGGEGNRTHRSNTLLSNKFYRPKARPYKQAQAGY